MLTSSRPPWTAPSYRPDIDGLRALSVIVVMLFHAFPNELKGGFIGVDVFFVISGFLIGGIITQELDAGSFSFRAFYMRRARRILPALVLVILFVLFVGWNTMFPSEFRQLGRHVTAAVLFLSNFALLTEVGYFDMEAHTKPLLHLWSLSIEEQYYVVWPLFAWILRKRRSLFLALTGLIAISSFLLSLTEADAALAFYSPLTRVWELAVGVLAAHLPRSTVSKYLNSGVRRNILHSVGFFAIVTAACVTDARSFPGWWPLLPVFGAAFVILSGPSSYGSWQVLGSRPMVWIGKISYPLYLWHWPLFAYAWLAYGAAPPAEVRWSLLLISVVFAWTTYKFVERPIRFGMGHARPVLLVAASFLALGAIGTAIVQLDGLPMRSVAELNRALADDLRVPTSTRTSDGTCKERYGVDTGEAFVCFVNSSSPRILVIGDSVSMAFYSAIRAGLVEERAAFVGAHSFNWARSECSYRENLEAWMRGAETCQAVIRTALLILAQEPSIEVLVIPTYSRNPFFTNEAALAALQQIVADAGKQVVYVLSVPQFGNPPGGCHPRALRVLGINLTRPGNMDSCRQPRSQLEPDLLLQRRLFQQLSRAHLSTGIFDAFEPFCGPEDCFQSDDSGPLYWSWAHINERGSRLVLKDFLPWLRSRPTSNERTP